MYNFLNKLFDFILPQTESVKFLESLGPDGLFTEIPRSEVWDLNDKTSGIPARAIFSYHHPLCRQAIWEIKFRGNQKLIQGFSSLLYEFILEEISEIQTFKNYSEIILIPIPTSAKRRRERGFNQCELIVNELIKEDKRRNQNNFTTNHKLLIKNTYTNKQSRTHGRSARLNNVINTMHVDNRFITENQKILYILIDDVITTGATITEAVRVLKQAGAKNVIVFALAH